MGAALARGTAFEASARDVAPVVRRRVVEIFLEVEEALRHVRPRVGGDHVKVLVDAAVLVDLVVAQHVGEVRVGERIGRIELW